MFHLARSHHRSLTVDRFGDHTQHPSATRTHPAHNPHSRAVIRWEPMKSGAPGSFGAQLKALREAAGFTPEELATVAGLSVHAVSALERGERRRPHADTVRALSAAQDLNDATRKPHLDTVSTISQPSSTFTVTGSGFAGDS